jgi:17beta-estradiol 17-dehydrogenase / very-long-chain 3-oxoacyl-CoA reductase
MANLLVVALAAIGAIVVLRLGHFFFHFLTFHLVLPSTPLQKYHRPGSNKPSYALVTGASAGIGLGVAQELIRHSFHLILVGHLRDELASAAAGLRARQPGADVRILVLDARTATPQDLNAAVRSIADLEVTVLVNNVGGNAVEAPAFRTFDTYSCDDVDAVVNQNARFMARLTALMLPLLARRREGVQDGVERSLVITMSSAGYIGLPWLVLYGATKAFNRSLGFGLGRELQAHPGTRHVDSVVVVPGDVRSQGNCRGLSEGAPTWDEFGRNIVRKVDGAVNRGWREMFPHWRHHLDDSLAGVLSDHLLSRELIETVKMKKKTWDDYYEKSR